jgi:WD40 repeat protein
VKRELERIVVPDAEAAEDRARRLVLAALAQREPVAPPQRTLRLVGVAAAIAVGLAAGLVTTPGRAVLDELREAVGVERAQPALFSLPASGPLLVASDAGVWVVQPDGSKRLLGPYREASWSPFGRFVVATRRNELAALEPDGDVRWTLARPQPTSPRWTGSTLDTRIAYTDRSGVRVVPGDGTGDRLRAPAETGPVAWRPGRPWQLAYVSTSEVRVQDTGTRRVLWRANRDLNEPVLALAWSSDGRRLLVLTPHVLRVFDERGRLVAQDNPSDATRDVDAAFRPGGHEIAVVRRHGAQSAVFDLETGRTLFSGTGAFSDVEWSPDGRWLVIGWPTADQWVFVRSDGRRIRAVANVSEQLRSRSFPRIEGWCCVL